MNRDTLRHTQIHTYTHRHKHTHTHINSHTHTHTHTHTHMHTHTHTHTQMNALTSFSNAEQCHDFPDLVIRVGGSMCWRLLPRS